MQQKFKKNIFYVTFLSISQLLVATEIDFSVDHPGVFTIQSQEPQKLDVFKASVDEIKAHMTGLASNLQRDFEQLLRPLKNDVYLAEIMQSLKKDVAAYFDFSLQFSIFDLPSKKSLQDFENWMTEKEFVKSCGKEAKKTYAQYHEVFLKAWSMIFVDSSDLLVFAERLNQMNETIQTIAINNLETSPYAKFLQVFQMNFVLSIDSEILEEANKIFIKTLKYRKDFAAWFKAFTILFYENLRFPVNDHPRAKKIVEDRVFVAKQLLPELESLVAKWSQE